MFTSIANFFGAKKATQQVEKYGLINFVENNQRDLLNNPEFGISKWTQQGKEELLQKCLADVQQELNKPDPKQAVRMRCFSIFIEAARYDVLVQQPPTGCKYLLGELKEFIPELAIKDSDLSNFFYSFEKSPSTFDEMWDLVITRYWILYFHQSAFNIVRFKLGDMHTDPTKDWFRVAYQSLCIYQEYQYRKILGLSSNIDGSNADLKSIIYSTWINRAEEGHQNLRKVWEESWVDCFKNASPYSGVAL